MSKPFSLNIHPKVLRETQGALQSFFKRREHLPEAYKRMSKDLIQEVIKLILSSDFCRNFMSRYYCLGRGYVKWAEFIAQVAGRLFIPKSMLSTALSLIESNKDSIYLYGIVYAYSFAFQNYPVYRVDEHLIDFLKHTELPKSFDFFQSVPLTLFILPENKFFDEEGLSINYIFVQFGHLMDILKPCPSEEYMELYRRIYIPKEIHSEPEEFKNSISVLFANKYIYWARRILKDGKLVKNLQDNSNISVNLDKIESELLRLAVHLLFIIHHEPNLIVSEGEVEKDGNILRGFGQKAISFSYPRKITIPWDEQYRAVGSSHHRQVLSSNHTKAMHWRRGHWRCLSRDEQRVIWVRPTLVNAPYSRCSFFNADTGEV